MNYINISRKKLVGRNNQVCRPFTLDYSTVEQVSFTFIDDNNKIIELSPELSGMYLAGSLQTSMPSYDLLFLSKDYTISNNVITFNVDTYTTNFLSKIKKPNTEIFLELGQIDLNTKHVSLRDKAYAFPRVYVDGLSPQEIDSHDFYNKTEVDERIAEEVGPVLEALQEHVENSDIHVSVEEKNAWNSKAEISDIPTKVSELENDSDFVNATQMGEAIEAVEARQLYATNSQGSFATLAALTSATEFYKADGTLATPTRNDIAYVLSDETHSNKSAKYTVAAIEEGAPVWGFVITFSDNTFTQEQMDAINSGIDTNKVAIFANKQDKITNDAKLDYALLSGTPEIPTVNDSTITLTQGGVQKGSFTLNQTSGTIIELDAGGGGSYSIDVPLEIKECETSGVFVADLNNGKHIQRYSTDDAVSEALTIDVEELTKTADNIVPTVELQIPITGDVSTITIPSSITVVDIPDTLELIEESTLTEDHFTFHDFVVRAEKDINGEWKLYLNHAYSFDEVFTHEDMTDYLVFEALEDNSSVSFKVDDFGLNNLYFDTSNDKITWTEFHATTTATTFNLNSGEKLYIRGENDAITRYFSNYFRSFVISGTGKLKINGNVLSLFSKTLEPKTLDANQAASLFSGNTGLVETSVNVDCLTNTVGMFNGCSNLSALPAGFSCENTTNTESMFRGCSSLSALPEDFRCQNVTNALGMFVNCSSLTGLPENFSLRNATLVCQNLGSIGLFRGCSSLRSLPTGFSLPNADILMYMFYGCSSLTGLPDGFSTSNSADTYNMFTGCNSLTTIGNNVSVPTGNYYYSNIDYNKITHIGDNLVWFTNCTFARTWDHAKGIRNVFPNVQNEPRNWRVYDHYDGELLDVEEEEWT